MADDVSLTEAERTRGRAFAAKLSMRVLARTWQMLLKGIEEVAAAGRPLAAAEMVLVRIAYAADLPTPDEVIRSLGEGARGNGGAQIPPGQPAPRADMPARAETSRAEIPRGSTRAALAELPRDAPVARGEESVSYTHLDVYKRQPRNVQRPAGDGEGELRGGEQLRNWILRLAREVARGLCVERIADRRHGDGSRRQHRRCAGKRLQRRHRHQRLSLIHI